MIIRDRFVSLAISSFFPHRNIPQMIFVCGRHNTAFENKRLEIDTRMKIRILNSHHRFLFKRQVEKKPELDLQDRPDDHFESHFFGNGLYLSTGSFA